MTKLSYILTILSCIFTVYSLPKYSEGSFLNVGNSDGVTVSLDTQDPGIFKDGGTIENSGISSYNRIIGADLIQPGSLIEIGNSLKSTLLAKTGEKRSGNILRVGEALNNEGYFRNGFGGHLQLGQIKNSNFIATSGDGSILGRKSGFIADSGIGNGGIYRSNDASVKNVLMNSATRTNLTLNTGDSRVFGKTGNIERNTISSNNVKE